MNLASLRQKPKTRRVIFIGGNLVALLFFYVAFIDPIRRFLDDRSEALQQRRATLARYEFVSSQETSVKTFAAQVAESNARGELIAGETAGIVNANLQARLKALAEAANVAVRSIQMLPPKNLRGAPLVGARLDVAAPLKALHAFARALESETPLLFVTAATMRAQTMFWGLGQVGHPQSDATLEAQFDVYGGALSKERS